MENFVLGLASGIVLMSVKGLIAFAWNDPASHRRLFFKAAENLVYMGASLILFSGILWAWTLYTPVASPLACIHGSTFIWATFGAGVLLFATPFGMHALMGLVAGIKDRDEQRPADPSPKKSAGDEVQDDSPNNPPL